MSHPSRNLCSLSVGLAVTFFLLAACCSESLEAQQAEEVTSQARDACLASGSEESDAAEIADISELAVDCATTCQCAFGCNFGTRGTATWCQCCAANCGGFHEACVQQGYGTSYCLKIKADTTTTVADTVINTCGYPTSIATNTASHLDFVVPSLLTCYQQLRDFHSTEMKGTQVIYHGGAGPCSSGAHIHVQVANVSPPYNFGKDCLCTNTTDNGKACTCQTCNCSGYDPNRCSPPRTTCCYRWHGGPQ